MLGNINFSDERAETNKNNIFSQLSWLISMENTAAFELKAVNPSATVLMLLLGEYKAGDWR